MVKKTEDSAAVGEEAAADISDENTVQTSLDSVSQETRQANVADAIKRNMLWSAGAGVLPVPALEVVAVTAVQLKLVKELADIYGVSYRRDLVKSAVLSLIGSLGAATLGKMLAYSSLKSIPIVGYVFAVASVPVLSAAITYAIGRVFETHFETGGTLLDFDANRVREYFRKEFSKGMKVAKETVAPKSEPGAAAA